MIDLQIIVIFASLLGINVSFIFLYDNQVNPKMIELIRFKDNTLKKEFEEMRKKESINIEETITKFSERLNEIRELKNRFNEITSYIVWSVFADVFALFLVLFQNSYFGSFYVYGMYVASGAFFALALLCAIEDIRKIHRWKISTKNKA